MRERGQVWLAHLDRGRGTEPGKQRPVLLIQAQPLLDADHPSTLVIPLTTRLVEDAEPLRVRVPASGRLARASDLLVDQLRTIDNRRLVEGPWTRLDDRLLSRVDWAMREVLGMAVGVA